MELRTASIVPPDAYGRVVVHPLRLIRGVDGSVDETVLAEILGVIIEPGFLENSPLLTCWAALVERVKVLVSDRFADRLQVFYREELGPVRFSEFPPEHIVLLVDAQGWYVELLPALWVGLKKPADYVINVESSAHGDDSVVG